MNIIEKQQIKYYHSSRIDKENTSYAQGWTSNDAQQKRFEVITGLLDFNDTSVLDMGCGCGDFKEYLDQRFKRFDYIGVDQQPEFIEYAQKRFRKQNHAWFHLVDFTRCKLPNVDIVVASGALSYKSSNPEYYTEMIRKFYNVGNQAFVFNMLDEDCFESGPLIVAHNKEFIYSECKKICNTVNLRTGYLKNDFTIIMKK